MRISGTEDESEMLNALPEQARVEQALLEQARFDASAKPAKNRLERAPPSQCTQNWGVCMKDTECCSKDCGAIKACMPWGK